MNKKSLMGLALAVVVTLSSTSVIAFASQNTEKSTRNVVKVEISNVKNISTNDKTKLMNISDEEAIQIAKKAIKDNFGVDVDQAGFIGKPFINTVNDPSKDLYKLSGPSISVAFNKPDAMIKVDKDNHRLTFDDASVDISLIDGKIKAVSFVDGIDVKSKVQYDENKLKQVAEAFLKEKGLRTDYKSIEKIGKSDYIPIGYVSFDYGDGTGEMISINLQNYKAYGYSPLNLKVLNELAATNKGLGK